MANPYFNAAYYLQNNPDVEAGGFTLETAEAHYIGAGAQEAFSGANVGRKPAPWFDIQYYLNTYPDLQENGITAATAFDHFANHGIKEGRVPAEGGQITETALLAYAQENADLATFFGVTEDQTSLTAEQREGLTDHFYRIGYTEPRPAKPVDIDDGGAPGETFTLTTGVDFAGPEAPENPDDFDNVIQTTSGDDTFEAVASNLTSERTLNNTDVIDGGEGNDTLKVALNSSFTGFGKDAGVKNVETIELTNNGSIARTFNATGIEGVETYKVDATKGDIRLTELAAAGITIELTGQADGAFNAGFTADAVKGDSALNLVLNGVGTDETEEGADDEEFVTVNAAGIEELTVVSNGAANFVNLAGVADAESITVSGDAAIEIEAVGAEVTAFDASATTGGVEVDLRDSGALKQVLGGAGDDVIAVNLDGGLAANAEIDGGEGVDALILSGNGTLRPTIGNIEVIGLEEIDGKVTISGENISDVHTIAILDDLGGDVSLANFATDSLTVDVEGGQAGTETVSYTGLGTFTLNANADEDDIEDQITGDANALKVNATKASDVAVNVGQYANFTGTVNANAAEAVTLNVASGLSDATTPVEQTVFAGGITANNAETVVVNASGRLIGGEITANAATSAQLNTGKEANTLTLNASNLAQLGVVAAGGLTLAGTLTSLQEVEASTSGVLQFGNLVAAAAINVSGDGNAASAQFGNLGAATMENGLALTASGLKAGLTAGVINTAGEVVNVDVSGVSGDVTIGDTTDAVIGAGNTTVTASGLGGSLTLDNIAVTAGSSVAVNADNVAGDTITLGDITVDTGNGSIALDFNGAAADVTVGVLTAGTVTIAAADLMGSLQVSSVVADKATVTGAELAANTVALTIAEAATVTGGLESDSITLIGATTAADDVVTFTLSGDLGADTFGVTTTGAGVSIATITDFAVGEDILDLGTIAGFNATTDAAVIVAALEAFGITATAPNVQYVTFDIDGNGTGAAADGVLFNGNVYAFGGDAAIADANTLVVLTGVTDFETAPESFDTL